MATDPNWPHGHIRGDFTDRRSGYTPTPRPAQPAGPFLRPVGEAIAGGAKHAYEQATRPNPIIVDPNEASPEPYHMAINPNIKKAGLSRVVKTAAGGYTDDPNATGDVRYYDKMGNRADRAAPDVGTKTFDQMPVDRNRYDSVGGAGAYRAPDGSLRRRAAPGAGGSEAVREFYRMQNEGPALSVQEIEKRGMAASELAAQKARENAPRITAKDAKLLSEARENYAQAANIPQQTAIEQARAQHEMALTGAEGLRTAETHDEAQRTALSAEFDALAAKYGPDVAFDVLAEQGRNPGANTPAGALTAREGLKGLAGNLNEGDSWLKEWFYGEPTGIFDNKKLSPEAMAALSYDDVAIEDVDPNFFGSIRDFVSGNTTRRVRVGDATYLEDDPEELAKILARARGTR